MINWQQFTTGDLQSRLALFQQHMEGGGLAAEDAFRMLDAIHTELEQQRGGQHALYAHYAGLMRQLQQADTPLYEQVVARYFAARDGHSSATDHEAQEPAAVRAAPAATAHAASGEAVGEEADEDDDGGDDDEEE